MACQLIPIPNFWYGICLKIWSKKIRMDHQFLLKIHIFSEQTVFSNQASTTEPRHRHSQLLAIATAASETAHPGGFHHGLTGKCRENSQEGLVFPVNVFLSKKRRKSVGRQVADLFWAAVFALPSVKDFYDIFIYLWIVNHTIYYII